MSLTTQDHHVDRNLQSQMSGGRIEPGSSAASRQPVQSSSARRGVAQVVTRVILVAIAAVLGLAAGAGALLWTATATDRVPLFMGAGFAGFTATFGLALLVATRGVSPSRRRRTRQFTFGAVTILAGALFAVTALVPLGDPRLSATDVPGRQSWDLPSGSHIAYVHLPAEGRVQPAPVIFLHGGPGVADMAGDGKYFGELAADGFDVYIYDQIGRGHSARLDDPRAYTLERDVADLEAIRQRIGAERLNLVGFSSGAVIASAYAAAHSEHVSRLVLISPGDGAPGAVTERMDGRLSAGERLKLYSLLVHPRALLGYTLVQVNPEAAYAFAGDAEMDARYDRVYNRLRPALHCAGKPPGNELHGLGYYAHYTPDSPATPPHADFMPALSGLDAPALIVKGRCDYLTWSSATDYRAALSGSRLVYFRDSGHNVYQDEPDRFMTLLRAFLLDQPLPEPVYEGHRMPGDYEGPA